MERAVNFNYLYGCSIRERGKVISPEEAAALVKSGDWIITGHSGASPRAFIQALVKRAHELRNVQITHVRVEGPAEYLEPAYAQSFFHNSFMIGPNSRQAMLEGRADFIPNRFGRTPHLIRDGLVRPDVAVLHLSPPDYYGYCSYGICTSYLPAAAEVAKIVIGEINAQMPVTFGSRIHISDLDYIIEASYPLYEVPQPAIGEVESKIGMYVASLIDDGATLQLGIGAIPDAVLASLKGHKDLGVHSEMFSDGIIELVEKGIINGRKKTLHPCKLVATFVMGTKKLYNFLNNNPVAEFYPVDYTNDPMVIAKNYKVVAINSALEVDVTGQICAESIGSMMFTGTGGQLDFALGASLAPGGKYIVAIPSTAAGGKISRIVANLKLGAGVSVPRTLADYVVTEYGIAELRGKNMRQRARALLNICHPAFREEVEREARERKDVHLD
ncbi:MAG: 4-hydroxybutyrate CoA-transferase [Clostridia bacterium]|nr:4-hydroxybutyrate CoA-transferase [Clostridia bacterium]